MEYKIFINNPWQENTVVLYDGTGEAVVIDCGCFTREEGKRLQDFLTEKGLKPVALLNTHLHPDHVFGNRFMLDAYGLAAQASQEDDFAGTCRGVCRHARAAGHDASSGIGRIPERRGYGAFRGFLPGVIAVPGHSPGGLCYYNADAGLLVSGDVLFAGSVGRFRPAGWRREGFDCRHPQPLAVSPR